MLALVAVNALARSKKAVRPLLLSVAMLVALVAVGCGYHRDYSLHPDIYVTVHNEHGEDITIEGVDRYGDVTDFGTVRDGRSVTLGLDDYWEGETLRARCTCDGEVIEIEFAYDGLHWDVL